MVLNLRELRRTYVMNKINKISSNFIRVKVVNSTAKISNFAVLFQQTHQGNVGRRDNTGKFHGNFSGKLYSQGNILKFVVS